MDTEALDTFDGFIVATKVKDGKTRVLVELPSPVSLGEGEVCQISVAEPMITERQRRGFFAICGDISKAKGMCKEAIVVHIKHALKFDSIRKLSKDEATDVIDGVLEFCTEQDITLHHDTWNHIETKQAVRVSYFKKCCIVCGKKADMHHLDAVGSGRNRNNPETDSPLIAICREHHTELHQRGLSWFEENYHLVGMSAHARLLYEEEKEKHNA